MTNFKDIKFTPGDFIKLAGFILMTGSMWFDLKSDRIKAQAHREFLQYQINELKRTCGFSQMIKPKEIKIEDENK